MASKAIQPGKEPPANKTLAKILRLLPGESTAYKTVFYILRTTIKFLGALTFSMQKTILILGLTSTLMTLNASDSDPSTVEPAPQSQL